MYELDRRICTKEEREGQRRIRWGNESRGEESSQDRQTKEWLRNRGERRGDEGMKGIEKRKKEGMGLRYEWNHSPLNFNGFCTKHCLHFLSNYEGTENQLQVSSCPHVQRQKHLLLCCSRRISAETCGWYCLLASLCNNNRIGCEGILVCLVLKFHREMACRGVTLLDTNRVTNVTVMVKNVH